MPIDVTLPPYNVRPDCDGTNFATATDNWAALQQACRDAGTVLFPSFDRTGAGDILLLPKGGIMLSQKLVVPHGVTLQGAGDYSTVLMMPPTFDPNSHFIDIGDATIQISIFGAKLKNMILRSPSTLAASTSTSMVYTNNAQDTDAILEGVRIYGFNRRCFWGEIGYGGASIVRLRQVSGNTGMPGVPAFTFNYGEGTMIDCEGVEPSGARKSLDPNSPDFNVAMPGTIGIAMLGGFASFRRMETEELDIGLLITMKTSKCFCDVNFATRGPMTNSLITISNDPVQVGRVRLANIQSSGLTVTNGESGASSIFGDIIDPLRL